MFRFQGDRSQDYKNTFMHPDLLPQKGSTSWFFVHHSTCLYDIHLKAKGLTNKKEHGKTTIYSSIAKKHTKPVRQSISIVMRSLSKTKQPSESVDSGCIIIFMQRNARVSRWCIVAVKKIREKSTLGGEPMIRTPLSDPSASLGFLLADEIAPSTRSNIWSWTAAAPSKPNIVFFLNVNSEHKKID